MDTPNTSTQSTTPTPPSVTPPQSSPSPIPPNPPTSIPPSTPPPTQPSASIPDSQNNKKKSYSTIIVILLILLAFIGGLALAGWYFQMQLQKNQAQNPTSPQLQSDTRTIPLPTKLTFGTDATFPPMEFMDKQGNMIGFDIDFGQRIAKDTGINVQFKNIKWDDVFTALENKQIDAIVSSVTITDERKQKYDFSLPYLNAGQVAITQRTNNTINAATDLRGKKIGIQKGTTNEEEAKKVTAPNLVIEYDDYQKATQALVNGQVDAILSDLTAAKGITTDNPTLKIATDPFTNEEYGIVFRKGENPQLEKRINDVISSLQTNGVLTDLRQKWLE